MKEADETLHWASLAGWEDAKEHCAKVADMRAKVFRDSDGQCSLSLQEECEDIAAAIRKENQP